MYICRIPGEEELCRKWDDEIARAGEDRGNWVRWKQTYLARYAAGLAIPYYGILDDRTICEATACVSGEFVQNGDQLLGEDTVYLCAFRTVEEFQGQGYFSRLLAFLEEDLRARGYRYATLGAEPEEAQNIAMYRHLGFDGPFFQGEETFPDGTKIRVDYFRKGL